MMYSCRSLHKTTVQVYSVDELSTAKCNFLVQSVFTYGRFFSCCYFPFRRIIIYSYLGDRNSERRNKNRSSNRIVRRKVSVRKKTRTQSLHLNEQLLRSHLFVHTAAKFSIKTFPYHHENAKRL